MTMTTRRTPPPTRAALDGRLVHALLAHLPTGWRVLPFGPDGAKAVGPDGSVIVTRADYGGVEWTHASIAHPAVMPTYDELCWLHRVVFGDGWSYQVFAPPENHVNIHGFALHLWGRTDGRAALPNFGARGSI